MNKVLHYAMNIGEQMLLCGADVHRVEECISRICYAFDADRIDVFIITSSMVATIYCKDGSTYTQTRRITNVDTDIEKLHLLNNLSRKICSEHLSFNEIDKEMELIQKRKKYNLFTEFLAYAIIACSFTLFFGGTVIESIVSFFVGIFCRFVALIAEKSNMSRLFSKFFCSFVSTVLVFTAIKIGIIKVADSVIIGNIMVLVPGIGITNALKDLLSGDNIAGVFRTVEAILYGLAIASGYFVAVFLFGGTFI